MFRAQHEQIGGSLTEHINGTFILTEFSFLCSIGVKGFSACWFTTKTCIFVTITAYSSQVFPEFRVSLKMAVTALLEIQVSLESMAGQVGLGTMDLLESVIHQPVREHQSL